MISLDKASTQTVRVRKKKKPAHRRIEYTIRQIGTGEEVSHGTLYVRKNASASEISTAVLSASFDYSWHSCDGDAPEGWRKSSE